jgi:copper transport protein
VGGLFHAGFLGPVGSQARTLQTGILSTALIALAVSVGLQGLDALGVPLAGLTEPLVWRTGFGGSYATAVLLAGLALLIGLIGLRVKQISILRTLASWRCGCRRRLTSTGHAAPRIRNDTTVDFLHVPVSPSGSAR